MQFAAEVGDVGVDDRSVGVEVDAPHVPEEFATCHDPGLVRQEILEESELRRRHLDGFIAHLHTMHSGIQFDRAAAEHFAYIFGCVHTTQDRLHAKEQFLEPEGLAHVVVGTDLQPMRNVNPVSAGGQHDHWCRLPTVTDGLHKFEAVHLRHVYVDDEQGRLGSRHDVQRLLAISGLDCVVPAEPEGVADQLAYAGFVVDNHHQRLHTPIPPHPGNPQGILRIDAAVSQPFHNLERHNCRVKPHRVLAVVVAAVLAAAPAAAADKPKPKPTDAKRMMVSKPTGAASMDMQQRAYLDAMKARKDAIKVINQTFGAAVKQAQRVYKDARAAAKSADAKNQAEAARKASIAAASRVRQNAINALGPAPKKPDPTATSSAAPAPSA